MDIEKIRGANAIEWLKTQHLCLDASFYEDPLGKGRVCEIKIKSAKINRSATGATDADAVNKVAIIIATELGWRE